MPLFDSVSLIASIASLLLAVLAIILSFVFYKMSTNQAKEIEKSSKDIAASVEKLEQLFDKLYSGTFSMMRDAVSEMSKHAWPIDREKIETDKLDELRSEMGDKINSVVEKISNLKQDNKDEIVKKVRSETIEIVNDAITNTRKIERETNDNWIRAKILDIYNNFFASDSNFLPYQSIKDFVRMQYPHINSKIVDFEIQKLKEDKMIADV